MVNEDILLSLKVDDETAIQNIVKLTQANNDLKKEIKDLNDQYKDDKSNAAYIAKVAQLNSQIKENTAGIRENSKEIKTNAAAIGAAEGSVNAARARVKDLTAAWESLSATAQKSDIGVKIQKELSTLNQSINSASISVSNFKDNIGNYSRATNAMSLSLSQLASEMPNFAQSMRVGIMSLSNNWMGLSQAIKMVREEQAILKKQFDEGIISEKPIGTIKTIVNGIVSWNTALMIGVTLLSIYGESIAKWVENLFKAEKNVDSLRAQHLGLTDSFKTMSDSMKSSTNEYGTAISQINKMSAALEQAKGNHKEEQKAVDDYNSSLGVTFGKAKDVDEALQLIAKNKDAYIQAMKEMSFSNAFFAKSSEDAVKIMEIQLKSNGEILGETANKYKEKIAELTESVKVLHNARLTSEVQAKKELNLAMKDYNEAAKKERDAQISAITKHQSESEKLAIKHYSNMSDIFDKHNFNYNEKDSKANSERSKNAKGTFDYEKELRESSAQQLESQLSRDIQNISNFYKDKQDKLEEAKKNGLVTEEQYSKLTESYEQASKEKISRIYDEYIDKTVKKLISFADKEIEQMKRVGDEKDKEAITKLELATDQAKSELDIIDENNQLKIDAEKNYLDKLQAEEEAKAYLRLEKSMASEETIQKNLLSIQKKYAKLKKDVDDKSNQAKLDAALSVASSLKSVFKQGTVAYKVAASAEAAISTYNAANKALAAYPPPFSYIAAGATVAAGIANVVKIINTKEDGSNAVSSASATPTTATTGLNLPPLSGLYKTTADTTETSQKILETQPTPVVRVSEINEVQNTVKVKELSKI